LGRSLDVFWPADLGKWLSPPKTKTLKTPRSRIPATPETAESLTLEQTQAMERLAPMLDGTGFRGALLHGVTGSGKTRVYLELVQRCIAQGGRALILVPEIALTPQTRDRFQRYLGVEVIVLHSNLSAPERRHSWAQLLGGSAQVVMGTRSAILAPGLKPTLIIIDEEHDSSYKQQDPAPRYHCRELAFHIAHRQGALVVLGSATPALETWEYARRGNLQLVQLKERARPLPLPHVRIIDLKQQVHQAKELLLSPALREAISETITQGHQAIILHNRRGFATSRICLTCGDAMECRDCKVPVILHLRHDALLCHYCGRTYRAKAPCAKCGGERFSFAGGAIEKVEREIVEWIPGANVVRMDRDSVQNIGSAERILTDFRAGNFNILLGTQMVAKGHDFPNVQLVGVISADTGASLPDFRSSERMFQLLTQVAGRAGRAKEGGLVLLQSYNTEDPVLRFALQHDYEGFASWELDNRRELGYPPFAKLLSIQISGKDLPLVDRACSLIGQALGKFPQTLALGPADAFISMVRGQHRKHFLVKGPNPAALRLVAESALESLTGEKLPGIQLKIDVDPQGLF
jgi:primosomal protein N' (replication factor Y)